MNIFIHIFLCISFVLRLVCRKREDVMYIDDSQNKYLLNVFICEGFARKLWRWYCRGSPITGTSYYWKTLGGEICSQFIHRASQWWKDKPRGCVASFYVTFYYSMILEDFSNKIDLTVVLLHFSAICVTFVIMNCRFSCGWNSGIPAFLGLR